MQVNINISWISMNITKMIGTNGKYIYIVYTIMQFQSKHTKYNQYIFLSDLKDWKINQGNW